MSANQEQRTITCEEALRLLATYLDGELADTDRGQLERHLELCRSCFSRHEFEKKLKAQLAELGQEPVRPEFRQRVRTLVGRFATNESSQ